MHHAVGVLAIIGLIAFAFGERVARLFVGAGLIAAALAFVYVMFLVVMDKI